MILKSEKREALEQAAEVDRQIIYRGHTFNLRIDTFTIEGKRNTRDIIEHPGAVVLIPLDHAGRLILVQQWRRAANRILIEFPAGTLELNELPKNCAQRELQEETGYKAQELISLGGFYSAPGFCTEFLHLFIAKNLHISVLPPDDGEEIDLLTVTLDKTLEMIDNGLICDAKTIAGTLRYQQWLKTQVESGPYPSA